MNTTQRGVLALMKAAITAEKAALPEQFDMERAYPVLRNHGIMALGYEGALRCGVDKTLPVMQKLRMDYGVCLLNSQRQMADIDRISQAFEEAGIAYMPLKGCNMKQLYPSHELRGMSDADILIRQEQYAQIRPIMLALGFEEKYESDHELVWQSKGLHLELHKKLVHSGNEDYYRYYRDGWRFAKVQNGCRYSMTKEDTFVFLFTHFAKHYRNGGVGCRLVADLWVFQRKYPQLNMGYVRGELAKLGLGVFFENMQKLLEVWFGEAQTDDKTDFMTDVIFANGNWGNADSRALAEFVRNKKGNETGRGGKLRWVMKRIFPPVQKLSYQYPVLKKWPVLLPAIWIWRCIYTVCCRGDKLRSDYKSLGRVSMSQIEAQEQALDYVGLHFGE